MKGAENFRVEPRPGFGLDSGLGGRASGQGPGPAPPQRCGIWRWSSWTGRPVAGFRGRASAPERRRLRSWSLLNWGVRWMGTRGAHRHLRAFWGLESVQNRGAESRGRNVGLRREGDEATGGSEAPRRRRGRARCSSSQRGATVHPERSGAGHRLRVACGAGSRFRGTRRGNGSVVGRGGDNGGSGAWQAAERAACPGQDGPAESPRL